MDEAVVAQLVKSDWFWLTDLRLSHIRLGSACVNHLAKGSWPKLESIDLTANQLDEPALAA